MSSEELKAEGRDGVSEHSPPRGKDFISSAKNYQKEDEQKNAFDLSPTILKKFQMNEEKKTAS